MLALVKKYWKYFEEILPNNINRYFPQSQLLDTVRIQSFIGVEGQLTNSPQIDKCDSLLDFANCVFLVSMFSNCGERWEKYIRGWQLWWLEKWELCNVTKELRHVVLVARGRTPTLTDGNAQGDFHASLGVLASTSMGPLGSVGASQRLSVGWDREQETLPNWS